jgi:hypothetical protein
MYKPTITQLKGAMSKKDYPLKTGEYELNIIGVRNDNATPNSFDDTMCVLFKDEYGDDVLLTFPITTDPGLYWLNHPMQVEGTGILKEGYYENAYIIGLHRGKYKALCQRGAMVTVIRDDNKDNILDFFSGKETTGFYGINIHRAKEKGETKVVDKFSAGCQVFENADHFEEFMELCEKSKLITERNRFSYTLLNVNDLKYS